jgi:hypothetical protein
MRFQIRTVLAAFLALPHSTWRSGYYINIHFFLQILFYSYIYNADSTKQNLTQPKLKNI